MASSNPDPFDSPELRRLQLFIYFIPVMGVLPALWTLYRRDGNQRQQLASRLSVILGLTWVLTASLLSAGASQAETAALSLWVLNSLATSSYFFVSFWLMVRVWQRKSIWIPGLSDMGDRLP
jgi:hypothetical protein